MSIQIPDSYETAVAYIEDLPRFTKKHSLEHTRMFLEYLGSPCNNKKIIHVAGTNGKGSVCAYVQAILESEGKKTGFFTSPHLVKINERIQIGRNPVDDEQFYQIFVKTMEAVLRMTEGGEEHPSYFEFLFGMGMVAFESSDVEYIVLETGLGGRLDATNAPLNPTLTIITSISLDHTDILGDTIEKIAYEKAGIIKKNVPVFFDGSDEKAAKVIMDIAEEKGAFCREITNRAFEIKEVTADYIAFSRENAYDKDVIWKVPICGVYQVMNAELAIQAVEYLLKDQKIQTDRWREAVASVRWEGRMEQIASELILDGAHNPGAIRAFGQSVNALHPEYRTMEQKNLPVILFSAVSDKKYEQMIQILTEMVPAKAYVITEIDDERKVAAKELAAIFKIYTAKPVYCEEKLDTALKKAYEVKGKAEIYCLGSLYLAGQVKKQLAGGETDVRF